MDTKQAFENNLESNITRLLDNYSSLLANAQVNEEILGHERLQLQASAANIVYSCQSLMDQVQELRLNVLLQDPSAILNESEEEEKGLQKRIRGLFHQKTQELLMSLLRSPLRSVLSQSRLHALTRREGRRAVMLQQKRSFYIIGPVLFVPALVTFLGVTFYQVYKKQKREEAEALENKGKMKISWRAKDIMYYGKKYAKREDSNEVYDHDSYKAALQNPDAQPILIGHWAADDDGKHYIKLVGSSNEEDKDAS